MMIFEEKKARRKEVRARSYAKRREANLAYAAAYRAANVGVIKAKTAGKHAAYSARYREKNYEKCLAMTQAWRESHPKRRAATKAKWQKDNALRHRTHQHNRRALERGGRLSVGLAEVLFVRQNGRCACCGMSLSDGYHLDHIIPLALGGPNVDSNIQLLAPGCNMRKGARRVG